MSKEDKDFLFRLAVAILTAIFLGIILVSLFGCTLSYKAHNTGQKYKHFEIRIFQKRDTVPFDTVRVKPIQIHH